MNAMSMLTRGSVLALLLMPRQVSAQVVVWPANGHGYLRIDAPGISWTTARAAAESTSFEGRAGHLVTITSPDESIFLTGHAQLGGGESIDALNRHWIGAYQPPGTEEPWMGWEWVTGEPFEFQNWSPLEPNDFGEMGEDFIAFNHQFNEHGKQWNDAPDQWPPSLGYLVEFESGGDQAPMILTQPVGASRRLGEEATFTVSAVGPPPPSYRWHKDGAPLVEDGRIAGVETSQLTIADVRISDAGAYHVVVTNPYGSVTSEPASLAVEGSVPVDPEPIDEHTLLYLSFDDTLQGSQGEQPTVAQGVTFEPGVSGAGARIPLGSSLVYDSSGKIQAAEGTVECWVKPLWQVGDTSDHVMLRWGSEGGGLFLLEQTRDLRCLFNRWGSGGVPEVGCVYWVPAPNWAPGQWRHVAFTWKSTPSPDQTTSKIYLDGILRSSETHPHLVRPPVSALGKLWVGSDPLGGGGPTSEVNAVMDELRVSSVERTAAEIADSHASGASLLVPTLVSQPQPLDLEPGATAMFEVQAESPPPIAYHWHKNGRPMVADSRVTGVGTSRLTIATIETSDAGAYQVVVTNPFGSVTSEMALLAVAGSVPEERAYRIGLNFGANERSGAIQPDERAGVDWAHHANWNNLHGPNGSLAKIMADDDGEPADTTASVGWQSGSTWASTGRGEENNSFTGPDRVLMTGYLDTGAQASTSSVTIRGLPARLTTAGYYVIVYLLGDEPERGGGISRP